MKYIRPVVILTVAALAAACSAMKKQPSAPGPVSGTTDNYTFEDIAKVVRHGYNEKSWPLVYYLEGIKQFDIYGFPEAAVRLYDEAIKLDSMYAPAYYEAARALAVLSPFKALEYSERANEIDTAQVWYKSQLGRLLVVNQDYDRAEKVYRELIDVSPRNPENYSMLAALYEYAGQPFSAIAVLDKAESAIGKTEQLTEYKRELLVRVGSYDKAIAEARDLVAANPYKYENHLALAQLYSKRKKDSLALESFRDALELNPDGVDIIISMNEYYKEINDNVNYLATTKQIFQSDDVTPESKVVFFSELISNRNFYREYAFQMRELSMILYSKYPDNWDIIELYVDNLFRFGEVEEALVVYKRYVGTGVGGIELYNEMINVEGYLQRSDSVDKYITIALEHYPENPDLYMRKAGVLQYVMKDDKQALKAYDKALKYASTDSLRSVVLGAVGDLYHQQGKSKKSYEYYERALKDWPDNIVVLNNYAYYLSEQGVNLERALEMSERVVNDLEPGNATYIDTYGWVLYKMGRYAEAKKILQQAVALDTNKSPELLAHYGDVLYALGEYYMASVYWNRALEAGYDKDKINERLETVKGK